jgi:hypothetical protein
MRARLGDLPDRQVHLGAYHSTGGEELRRAGADTSDEVAHRLAAVQAVPALLGPATAQLCVRLGGLLGRAAVPQRVTDLLEPRIDHLVATERLEQRLGGLAGAHERRHEDLVEVLVEHPLGEQLGLAAAEIGERRIDDGQAVAHPLRLSVADQHDLHGKPPYGRYSRGQTPAVTPIGCAAVTNDTGAAPGWYADPMGRYEHRYFNGRSWTSDVSSDGQRFVDPLGITPTPDGRATRANPGIAVASMVLGIIGISLAWVPFLVALGLVAAVLAIALGIFGLRRARRTGANQSFAVIGVATGAGALAVAVVGVVLTITVLDAWDAYLDPAPNETAVIECDQQGSRATMTAELTNLGDTVSDFSVEVGFVRSGTDDARRTERVALDDVGPGETIEFEAQSQVGDVDVDCVVLGVDGPLPFGIVVD